MVHIKLCKGLSYTGEVRATIKNPDVYVTEAVAKKLAASGYFIVVETDSKSAADEEKITQEKYGGKPLEVMNKSELETFAVYRDVDIRGAKTKSEIIEKLKAALPAEDLEGDISYGSPTMQELQR